MPPPGLLYVCTKKEKRGYEIISSLSSLFFVMVFKLSFLVFFGGVNAVRAGRDHIALLVVS